MPPKPDTPEERPRDSHKFGRRSFITKALAAGAVGAGAYFLGMPKARAEKSKEATETPEEVAERHRRAKVFKKRNPDDKPDPSYRNHTRRMEEKYEYKEAILSPEEIKLMDESMRAIFRSFIQPSFFMYAVPALRGGDIKKAMKLAVANHGSLEYAKDEDGYIVIKKRQTNNPSAAVPDDFTMKIKDGVITEINGEKIDMRALRNWKEEWDDLIQKIEEINAKLLSGNWPSQKIDWQTLALYCFKLPRELVALMELKDQSFVLSKHEKTVLQKIKKYINKGQPNTVNEFIQNDARFFVVHKKGAGNILELTDASTFKTFAAFSPEGFIQTNTATSGADPAWQNSSESFENLYKRNNGI